LSGSCYVRKAHDGIAVIWGTTTAGCPLETNSPHSEFSEHYPADSQILTVDKPTDVMITFRPCGTRKIKEDDITEYELMQCTSLQFSIRYFSTDGNREVDVIISLERKP
jgi:hypothetical protein